MISICVLNGCVPFLNEIRSQAEWENRVTENNQKGYDLIENGKYEEAIPYLDEAVKYVYKLEPGVVDLDHEIELSELMDSPFNNLSWAYNELREFDKSLENIEKSLLILPNTDVEYVNKGNALYGLNRYDEALINYDRAIALEKTDKSAYYGKGMIFYDRQQYQDALKQFDTYLTYDDNDMDALEMKIYSHIRLGETKEALAVADDVIGRNSDQYEAYEMMADVLEETGDFEEIKKQLEFMSKKFPDRMDVYVRMINTYSAIGKQDEALSSYARAVKKDKSNIEVQNAMGSVYMNKSMYVEALTYYDKAVNISPRDETANINKLRALYSGKRNLQCVAFGAKAMKYQKDSSNIAWYTGKCNMELGNYEEAIGNFQSVIDKDENDDEAYANIAYAQLMLENNGEAEKYSAKSLSLYSDNSLAQYIKDALRERSRPLGQQIKKFFEEQYLYGDGKDEERDKILSKLDDANVTTKQIAEIIDRAKKRDDRFTFTLYGEVYDQVMMGSGNEIKFEDQGDIAYFRIVDFNANTDDAFIEKIDGISDTPKKTLVIDLRGNTGGVTDSANNMLDVLLPDYVTSTLIYKDGYTDSYYSDASHVDFKKIFILVDENTASAAELLTLGLKTYLKNVTVIGRNTFGKGVGQRVFEDKSNKIMVFVVNHYWNVKQNNIMNSHIKPDIYIKGNSLESFMKPVKASIK